MTKQLKSQLKALKSQGAVILSQRDNLHDIVLEYESYLNEYAEAVKKLHNKIEKLKLSLENCTNLNHKLIMKMKELKESKP